MTRTKEEIAKRVKKNVPTIWETYPYATAAIVIGSVVVWEVLKFGFSMVF
jgi:hypothetical protein